MKSELVRHREILERGEMTFDELKRRVDQGLWPLPHSIMERTWRWRRDIIEAWFKDGRWPKGATFKQGAGLGRETPEQG